MSVAVFVGCSNDYSRCFAATGARGATGATGPTAQRHVSGNQTTTTQIPCVGPVGK